MKDTTKEEEPVPAGARDERGDAPLLPEFEAYVERVVEEKLAAAPPKPEPLWTVSDVADYFSVSTRTIETLIAEQAIHPLRIRGSRRFTPEAIRSYLHNAAA